MLKISERKIRLQLFAEDAAGAAGTEPATAEKNDTGAAADQAKETKTTKETKAADEKKYSDKDLDEIIGKKFAKWQQEHEKKVEAAASEAKKLAEMNEQQKAEYALNKEKEAHAATQKELDEYKRKDTLAEMTKTARKMLSDDGISVSDDILSLLVTTDAEKTKTAIEGFSKAYKADVENGVKEKLRGKVPTAGTGGSSTPVTEIEKRIQKYN